MATGSPAEVGAPSITAGGFLACNKVIVLDKAVDPLAYVVSANIHRRHLTIEDKDRLIVQLLKADPTKSNRRVAKLTDTSHPHVAKVREHAEKGRRRGNGYHVGRHEGPQAANEQASQVRQVGEGRTQAEIGSAANPINSRRAEHR